MAAEEQGGAGTGVVGAHAPEGSPGDVVAADVGVLLGGAQGARGCRRVKSQRLIDACCQIWELLAKAGCVISVEQLDDQTNANFKRNGMPSVMSHLRMTSFDLV